MKSEDEGKWQASDFEKFTFPKIHNPTESYVCKEMITAQIYPLYSSPNYSRDKERNSKREKEKKSKIQWQGEKESDSERQIRRERQKARTWREVNRQKQKRGMRLWSSRQEKGGGSAEWEDQRCVSGMCVRERTLRPSHTQQTGRPAEPSQGETLNSPEPWGQGWVWWGAGSYAVGGAKRGWSSEEEFYWVVNWVRTMVPWSAPERLLG